MPNFLRYYIPNAITFITCITRDRFPYLKSKKDVDLFFETLARADEFYRFELLAYVVLPDHFHWLMKVDDSSGNFSKVMHSIKRNFTLNYKKAHHVHTPLNIWQSRFWDHVIRDTVDLEIHIDYIHWNPVKHGYAYRPERWPYSTYQEWMDRGYYMPSWGCSAEPENLTGMDFE